MAFKDLFTLMSIETQESPEWKYDHNTTVILIVQSNLAALLKACLVVSDQLEHPEKIDLINMINGLTDCLEWMQENTEMVIKDGSK